MGKKGKIGVGRAVLKDKSKGGSLRKNKESWVSVSNIHKIVDFKRLKYTLISLVIPSLRDDKV